MVEAPPTFVVIAVMTEIDASRSVVVGKISDITDKIGRWHKLSVKVLRIPIFFDYFCMVTIT